MIQIINIIIKLCFTVNLNSCDSLPVIPVVAAATAIDCGDIIFPTTPPEQLAATVTTGLMPIDKAVFCCSLPNNALAAVSDPVINTPNHPNIGEKNGNNTPVLANA